METLPFRNLQGEFFLNKPDQIRWEMPLYDEHISFFTGFPGLHEIRLIRRSQGFDRTVFCGPLWDYVLSSEMRRISGHAQSLDSYLDVRRVDENFKETGDAADVAWNLIQDTQALVNGNLGIVLGLSPTTFNVTVDVKKSEGKYIFDVIDDLSKSDPGFDWQIDSTTRAFDVWFPRKDFVSTVDLEYGGNVKKYAMQLMGKYLRNDVLIRGEDAYTGAVDGTSRTKYGLRHYVDTYMDAVTVPQLQARAQLIRSLRREPKKVPSVVVDGDSNANPYEDPNSINTGFRVNLKIKDGPMDFEDVFRVIGWQLTIGQHDKETFVYYLNDLREVEEVIE
jgi:hypothetical protein